tara:strand:+ start:180 stop:683 length:504 start_codon:yes stop_codon:yes gene_type:complete
MKTFHVDEPREIGKKRVRLNSRELGMVKDDLYETLDKRLDEQRPCWKGYKMIGMKDKDGKKVPNCVPIKEYDIWDESCGYTIELEPIEEGEYQGRDVKLNKPMQGDSKKFKVYVKNNKGNVVKVNFGQKGMNIKKSNPERRKSFRARHNCDNPGPKWKARYWSCRKW